MKLRFPPTRYRVVRDSHLGYEAQFRPWWSPFWWQCNGVNTNISIRQARQVCVNHASGRGAAVVAQFSTRELEAQHNSTSSDWDGIVRCADDIEPRLRLLLGRMAQDQQEVNDLCELSSRIAEGDQAADSHDWDGIVQCADDIESRLRVLRGRIKQNQQEVNDLRYRYELSSRLAELEAQQ